MTVLHILSFEDGLEVLRTPDERLPDLLARANQVRLESKGRSIKLCGIVNAKSGLCPEDCAFCAQSSHHSSDAPAFPLLEGEDLVEAAGEALERGATEFSIVTSGRSVSGLTELETVGDAVERISRMDGLEPCASLGLLERPALAYLKRRGLRKYHHNLEAAPSFFPQICGTHDQAEDVATVREAKAEGLSVCCGGILGMGESPEQRVELAFALRELNVDCVPLNFLNPIPGTPLHERPLVSPAEALKIIALFRLALPDKDIFVSGGREVTLRGLQGAMFWAGANGTLVGNYLTTQGRSPEEDLTLISDLGLSAVQPPASHPANLWSQG